MTVPTNPANDATRERIPKAEQTRRTRKLIVETGMRCLAEVGYAATTMLLIAQEAGISRGPLHYHFADRNALMAAIADALPQDVSKPVLQRLASAGTIDERLSTIVDIALDEHLGRHHFTAMELLLAARNDPALAAAIRPHFLESEQVIDDWWAEYLALLRWPRERLIAFRHVTVACLRGLALDHLLQGDARAHADAIEVFRAMFLGFAKGD